MEILWGVHVVRQAQSYPPSTETEAATNHSLGLATTFGGAPYVAKVVLKKCFLWVIPQLTFYLTLYLDNLSDILSDVLSDIYSDSLSGILLSGLCSGPWLHPQLRFLASKNFGPLDPPTTEMAQILFAAWELPLSPHRPRQCPAGTKGFPPSPELVFRENTYPPKKKGKLDFLSGWC
jgi:hypothetical protein